MTELTSDCILDAKAILGEGPSWDLVTKSLLWIDIENRRVHRYDPATRENKTWQLEHRVGFAVPTAKGDILAGTQQGIVRLDPNRGTVTPLSDPESDQPQNRFNDGKCDPVGRIWAGTMCIDEEHGANQGKLYRIDGNVEISKMLDDITISNGLAWSADQKTMYYIDTPTMRVDAFDFEADSGTITNRRPAIQIPEGIGYPDGMTIDAEGMLWVALWQGWGVTRWNPATGEMIGKISVPVERVTSCCFGGDELKELFITTASRDMKEEDWPKQPQAGGLFVASPGVSGLSSVPFSG